MHDRLSYWWQAVPTASMLAVRCRPPGSAMPGCTTCWRSDSDDRQHPLPWCSACAAARPAARCHDVWAADV